jgi:hypothetical protein
MRRIRAISTAMPARISLLVSKPMRNTDSRALRQMNTFAICVTTIALRNAVGAERTRARLDRRKPCKFPPSRSELPDSFANSIIYWTFQVFRKPFNQIDEQPICAIERQLPPLIIKQQKGVLQCGNFFATSALNVISVSSQSVIQNNIVPGFTDKRLAP